jgi:hypothetical protein
MSFPGDCAGAACTPFTNKCRAIILGLGLPVPGLVDAYGVPMRDLTNNTWGVNYTTCETHCGFAAIPVVGYACSLPGIQSVFEA